MAKSNEEFMKQQLTGSIGGGDEDYLYEQYLMQEKLNEEYWEQESVKNNSIFPDGMESLSLVNISPDTTVLVPALVSSNAETVALFTSARMEPVSELPATSTDATLTSADSFVESIAFAAPWTVF